MLIPLALQLLFGATLPLNKWALSYCPPLLFSGLRMTVGGIICLGIARFQKPSGTFSSYRALLPCIGMAALMGVCLKSALKYYALQQLPVLYCAIAVTLGPLCVGIFESCARRVSFSRVQWAALWIVAASMPLSAWAFGEPVVPHLTMVVPSGLLLLSLVCGSYSTVCLSAVARDRSISLLALNGLHMLLGGVALLFFSVWCEPWVLRGDPYRFIGVLMLIVFVGNILSHTAYLYLLRTYSATRVAFADLAGPACAALYAVIFLGETVPAHGWCALLFASGASFLFCRIER